MIRIGAAAGDQELIRERKHGNIDSCFVAIEQVLDREIMVRIVGAGPTPVNECTIVIKCGNPDGAEHGWAMRITVHSIGQEGYNPSGAPEQCSGAHQIVLPVAVIAIAKYRQ